MMHQRKLMASLLCCWPLLILAANQNDLEKLAQIQHAEETAPVDLSRADLRRYTFIPGKINLQFANLSHSNLSGVDLSKMNLFGADLSYSDLSNSKLNTANLTQAKLDYANLAGAELQAADFTRASLRFTNLSNTESKGAIFTKAILNCANLNGSDLSQANFLGADISGATFVNTITDAIVGYDVAIDQPIHCDLADNAADRAEDAPVDAS